MSEQKADSGVAVPCISLLERVEELERRVGMCDKREATCRVLEDVQDRACRNNALKATGMSLSQFTDWIRGLYPEYYTSRSNQTADHRPTGKGQNQ